MGSLSDLWSRFTLSQRATLLAVLVAVAASVWGISRWTKEQDFKPLFVNVSPEEASAIVSKLKEAGNEYRLDDSGTRILVPSAQLNELRIKLAGEGLPKTGRLGFEIFDKMNLAMTEFAEQVNYQRALEGELERTILTLHEIEQARVHITPEKESLFVSEAQPAKASVILNLKAGAKLSAQNIAAVANLTASAVKGLDPNQVTIVDMNGTLLSKPKRETPAGQSADELLDYRQQLERDLAGKVNATLEPLLGAEKFRVGIFADCDFTTAEQNEETYDPAKSVMTQSQKTEEITSSKSTAGVPGTPSNLPRPVTRPPAGGSNNTRRTENISYQSSRTQKKTLLPRGAIKRLSVSVLVDQRVRWTGAGKTRKRLVEPLSAADLQSIRDVVSGVVGLQSERGDQLVVQNLPFANTLNGEEPLAVTAPAEPEAIWKKYAPHILAAGAACFILTLGVFLLKGRKRKAKLEAVETVAGELSAATANPAGGPAPALTGTPQPAQLEPSSDDPNEIARQTALRERKMATELAKLRMTALDTPRVAILTRHMSEEAKDSPETIAQVVRSWLQETQNR